MNDKPSHRNEMTYILTHNHGEHRSHGGCPTLTDFDNRLGLNNIIYKRIIFINSFYTNEFLLMYRQNFVNSILCFLISF